jgi:hypothetical protein
MIDNILAIIKARLNMMADETALDEYLTARIKSAISELADNGIHVKNTSRDTVFVADLVCWQYSNRDKNEPMPEWLRLMRRERWLAEVRNDT